MKNNDNKAVILARVSSKGQEDEGYSLDSQIKLLKGYAENKELRVAETFKITETASKSSQRKTFRKAMDFIEDHDIKHLIIEKVDRHVRNLHDAVETHDWLVADEQRHVHFIKDSLVLHKNSRSQEWLNWGIRVVMAKNYIDNLREEAMKGWAEKLAQGWLPAPPPPGYHTVVKDGKRIHIPNPSTYKTMQKVLRHYITPSGSIDSVHSMMAKSGIVTRGGKPYQKSAVHKLLSNPFYIGINRHNGKEYQGKQIPLISEKLFDAIQAKLHGGRPSKFMKHNPMFKNIITCGHCGKIVTWQRQKGRLYGACQRDLPECRAQKFLREEDIEERIIGMLDDLISPSKLVVSWLTDLLRSDFKLAIDDSETAKKNIEHRIVRLKRMDETLYDDKLLGEISPERYRQKHEAFVSEIKELEKQKGGMTQEYQEKYLDGITLIELTQTAKAQFLDPEIDMDEKRTILTKLFENMTFKDGFISVKYTKLALAIASKSAQTREIYANVKIA